MKRIYRIITIAVGGVTLLLCCYIMVRGLGLVKDLDFGAGAYYYADIPEFDRYASAAERSFDAGNIPSWVYYLLFFCWGYLMWRIWRWIESRK